MNEITVSAKTLDDAITEASIQLGVASDQMEYDVIEKGSAGFLGIGSRQAVIRARIKKTVTEELIPILENYLNESLDLVSIKKQHLQIGYTSILLKHELKYTLQLAKKQYALDQQCGDSILTFGLDEHHYVALSDGMPQGYIAYKESKLTLDVLSQLLKNGIQLRDTLNTLNTLLKIKNQGDMYTTLDLFDFNLI